MTDFTMPPVEDYVAALTQRSNLLRSTGWELAAIVAAAVGPRRTGRDPMLLLLQRETPFTVETLAAMGIRGLTSEHTVRRYRDAWFSLRDDIPQPGETLELPEEDFPESRETQRKHEREAAAAALASAASDTVITVLARHHGVTPEVVKADAGLSKVAEFAEVRVRDAVKAYKSSVHEEAERLIPAMYAEADGGDVVAVNRRARSISEREWEARTQGVERQWEKAAATLARARSSFGIVGNDVRWLTNPQNPRVEGAEAVLQEVERIKEDIWAIEARIRSATTPEDSSEVA